MIPGGSSPSGLAPAAFTCRYPTRSLTLISEVHISAPESPNVTKPYKALYDTGATHSAITPRVVADLTLPSIGAMTVGVGGGQLPTTGHVVNIGLPNAVMFAMVRVASMALHQDIDVLVGMDILGIGDFAVTHHQGRTTFSFRVPSHDEIDFVKEIRASQPKPGRNDPCFCGSGKKYKKCHGA